MKPKSSRPNEVPAAETQLLLLRDRLEGYETFKRMRGRGRDSLERVSRDCETPSAFRTKWRSFSKDAGEMGWLLIGLERNGWKVAAEELREALRDEYHYLYGEAVAEERFGPRTICIAEFSKQLAIFRWFWERTSEQEIEQLLKWGPLDVSCPAPEEVRILEGFENSVALAKASRHGMAYAIYDAFSEGAVRPTFKACRRKDHLFKLLKLVDDSFPRAMIDGLRYFPIGSLYSGDITGLREKIGVEGLSGVDTWKICLPGGLETFGLHPQADHEYWQNRIGMFTSKTCTNGYGLAVFRRKTPAGEEYLTRYKLQENYDREPLLPDQPLAFVFQQA